MKEKLLRREEVLEIARGLEFMGQGCWLTAGAALVLQGVKETTHDVDIVCTTQMADQLEAQGVPFRKSPFDNTRIFAYNQDVEVLENWFTDKVITVEGLQTATVESIRKQKAAHAREKDLADIALIDQFLEKGKQEK